MSADVDKSRAALDEHHASILRDPHQIVAQGIGTDHIAPEVFKQRVKGAWWDILEELGATVVVSREYEHLLMAYSAKGSDRQTSFQPLAHPSGLAFCADTDSLYAASTRNPNQVVRFGVSGAPAIPSAEDHEVFARRPLMPVNAQYYPGRLYLHDLALVGRTLFGTATGMNTVCALKPGESFLPAWWPKSVDVGGKPDTQMNYIQLNSIAATYSIGDSFFAASCAAPGRYRPGQLRWPVDKQGVVFSGRTRDVFATGLTRPHSLRIDGDELWVANSGYGEVGVVAQGEFNPVAKLPGWTRGLALTRKYVFVATSRVIPRFQAYAPGVDLEKSTCAIHVIDRKDGKVLGSVRWPYGNQVFAIELIPRAVSRGFATLVSQRRGKKQRQNLYYSFGYTS